MTTAMWTLLAVILIAALGTVIFRAAGKARDKAAKAESGYDRTIDVACSSKGHVYKIHETGWRCATCGNFVARREGELYGPADEGRVERRREGR